MSVGHGQFAAAHGTVDAPGDGQRAYTLEVAESPTDPLPEDTGHLRLAASLRERLECETLLSDLSARFARLSGEDVAGEIELWLGRLVKMLDVDRATFAELTPGGFVVTHSCAVPGIEPYPKGLADAAYPWLTKEFAAGRTVLLSRIPDDLPEHAVEERRSMTAGGMKAGIGIPVSIGGSVVCVLTFAVFRQPRTWPDEVISRLHLAGDAFANAVARRQSKQRLEQKQNELAHVSRVAAMGELASVIAHELDQPLTAVVNNAEAARHLLRGAEPQLADADEALKEVVDAAMRMSEIIERERRLLRRSQGGFGPVDVNDVVREVELFIRAEARQHGARVTMKLLPGLPAVWGDRVQLEQVALNLARNALQAMRGVPGGELVIRTESERSAVVLTVTDAGPPVQESHLQRMFEPFYTTKANGLGMGLPISKSIVDAHGGRIWATRNPAAGLTMHVSIPKREHKP